jgi:hypothetical protein
MEPKSPLPRLREPAKEHIHRLIISLFSREQPFVDQEGL